MRNSRFARFVLAGGVAAAANYGSRFLFSIWMIYEVAVTMAYLVGMSVAFVLMRHAVFDAAKKAVGPQVVRFAAVNVLALLQTLVVSVALARWVLPTLGMREGVEALAHLCGVAVPIVTSYFGHKALTFR